MKSDEYISEYNRFSAVTDLNRMKEMADRLIRLYDKPNKKLTKKAKKSIIDSFEKLKNITNIELDKELAKQKKKGKAFISHTEIDNLISKFLKEEGL